MTYITVVITTYNLEQYINRTLEELSWQTMQDFEILIVDDASTDKTCEIVEQWKSYFGERLNVIYLSQNLGMPAKTRNVALDSGKIHGDYVLFLDGDDSIEKNMLEVLYQLAVGKAIIQNGEHTDNNVEAADVVICAYNRVDINTNKAFATEMQSFPTEVVLPPSNDLIAFINTSPWNKLWKREVIEELRYPAFKVGEEVSFNFKGYQNSHKLVFTDQVLIHYSVHADSIISNTDEETIWAFADELRKLYYLSDGVYKDLAGFIAFIHIGLSMALRAADNPRINISMHIKKTEKYFSDDFNWLKNNQFIKFTSLCKHGLKGIILYGAYLAYRCKIFGIALRLYRLLGLNMKF